MCVCVCVCVLGAGFEIGLQMYPVFVCRHFPVLELTTHGMHGRASSAVKQKRAAQHL